MAGKGDAREKLHKAIRDRGWWQEFRRRVDELVADDNLTRAAAERVAGEEFSQRLADDAAAAAIDQTPGKRSYVQDAEWAYQHLDDANLQRNEAPSAGAWSLLKRARVDPSVLDAPLMLAAKRADADAEEHAIQGDCQRTDAELSGLIDRLLAAQPIDERADEIMRTYCPDRVQALIDALTARLEAQRNAGDAPPHDGLGRGKGP
jgi:hypothetical protein